jgi:hypothetical protein
VRRGRLDAVTSVPNPQPRSAWAGCSEPRVVRDGDSYNVSGTAEQYVALFARLIDAGMWEDGADHPLEWQGCRTRDVPTLASRGWVDAVDHARGLFAHVTATKTRAFPLRVVRSCEPGDVDVEAYLADDERCFHSIARDPRTTRAASGGVVRIEHNLFAAHGVNSAVIVERGTVLAGLIYILERAGKRCEVICRLKGVAGSFQYDFRITVKRAYERLDLARLLYWIGHSSVLRVGLHAFQREAQGRSGFYPGEFRADRNSIATPDLSAEHAAHWLDRMLNSCGFDAKVRM